MERKNIPLMIGIVLILLAGTLIGSWLIGQPKQPPQTNEALRITLQSFSGIWDFHHPNESSIGFELCITNPSDQYVTVESLSVYIRDDAGGLLLWYRPFFHSTTTNLQPVNELIILHPRQNITVQSAYYLKRNQTSLYVWQYLSTPLNKVSVSGLYTTDGVLHWFETHSCTVTIPICRI